MSVAAARTESRRSRNRQAVDRHVEA
jgi:hypothetical protein